MLKDNFLANRVKIDGSTSIVFDFFRAFSALLVLVTHLRGFMFVPYDQVTNQNIMLKGFYFFTSLGQQAVMVFFVLSGFFITSSVLGSFYGGNWSWKDYSINRLSRLYTVLIPALFLTAILDWLSVRMLGVDNSYTNDLVTFFGNAFFLQDILVPIYGSNGPLWSLNYEFWYYLLFPLGFIGVYKTKSIYKKIMYALLICVLMFFIGKLISLYAIIWLLGFAILVSPSKVIKKGALKTLAIVLLLVAFAISLFYSALIQTGGAETTPIHTFYRYSIVAIIFSLIMYVILNSSTSTDQINKSSGYRYFKKISKLFADFSFTLYLVHYPIIAFLMSLFTESGGERLQPTIANIFIFSGVSILVMFISYCISALTEAHTNKVRGFLRSLGKKNEKVVIRSTYRNGL